MTWLRATSIQRKLVLLVMVITSIALLVAAVQFVLNDVWTYRRTVLNDLSILATIVGQNCTSAVEFGDAREATRTLAALEAKPQVAAAAVYTPDGKRFASFTQRNQQASAVPERSPPVGHQFLPGRLVLCQKISHGEEKVGTIYLDFDLSDLTRRTWQNCGVVAVMLLVSAIIALLLTSRLQQLISQPLLDLAQVARAISEKRDYSVRAVKRSADEVGMLIESFNGMLGQIEKHEKVLREVNQKLADSQNKAMAATEAKSQFLANMSHELRTPLNAIIGYSELLLEELEEAGQNQLASDLNKIHAAARHQLGLINDILDLSKIEAGKMTLFVENFDVGRMVDEVISTVRPLVAKSGNQLEVSCPSDIGFMRADQTKVRQILFNLLSNANKFTEANLIRLEVHRDATPPAGEPNSPAAVSRLVFQVSDRGIGMTAEQMTRLFRPFTQAEASTTRKYGGTGLGLAISRSFSEMMGGELTVVSEPGKGSTFTVKLPVEVPEPVPESKPVPEAGVRSATSGSIRDAGTVLVIDDEPAARDLVQRTLVRAGFQVHVASSGPEGLDLAARIKPSAITLDVMMPGLDGWAVLTRLKADPQTVDIPVIMMTVVDDKNLGFALGAADYLIKPIEWNRLVAVLERHCRHRSNPQVLIIEDDPSTRDVLRRAVEKQGWQVVEAENGRVGLERLSVRIPGVILLDLMMPEMDGFSFMEALRRRPDCRQVPVIVVTAKDLTTEDRSRLNGHVIEILQKGGYSTSELIEEIRTAITAATDVAKDI
ncbi:MAG TPA: response regulator [Verrucomicrobiota bacterium]|nr:hybrid sensor histidine kinase/response regulator [Verrucomicrobiales bacterium]HRI13991.1 response regulator [Verrucomicrobiota bacterium]